MQPPVYGAEARTITFNSNDRGKAVDMSLHCIKIESHMMI